MMNDDEANFARRMATLRTDLDMSQSELARRMVENGFDTYSQMTVSRTEKGDRPIRLGEARVLAQILGSSVEQMTRGSDLEENLSYVDLVKHGLTTEILETAHRLSNYVEALEHAGEAMSRLQAYDAESAREAISDLATYTFPAAVVASWAAEVATDPMRDAPESLDWKDLTRLSTLEEASRSGTSPLDEPARRVVEVVPIGEGLSMRIIAEGSDDYRVLAGDHSVGDESYRSVAEARDAINDSNRQFRENEASGKKQKVSHGEHQSEG